MKEFLTKLFLKYKPIILYLVFGGLTTAVDIFVFWLLNLYLGERWLALSFALSWVAAVLFAYLTNRRWVFESKASDSESKAKELFSFFSARILTGLLGYLVLKIAVFLGIDTVVAKAFSNVLVIVVNYLASKFFVFKK